MLRVCTAWSALALAILWSMSGAFLLDWWLEMNRAQRFVSLVMCIGVAVWAYRRFSRPLLGWVETDLDLALSVEQGQHIDNDLVAALQFESPQAAGWGSGHLRGAVIDYVSEFGKTLNVFTGLPREQFRRRMMALSATIGVLVLGTAASPACLAVFLNRFFLGSAHYPSLTVLSSIWVNGTEVHAAPFGPPRLRCAFGQPLRFRVSAMGPYREKGEVKLTAVRSHLQTVVQLQPQSTTRLEGGHDYAGELPRLVDSVSFQVFLGDAWTDPLPVELIPLPVVKIDLDHIPPAYAAAAKTTAPPTPGARQVSVIEGSQVVLRATSLNKPLKSARLTIGKTMHPLTSTDQEQKVWGLGTTETPFSRVVEPLTYEVQVEDIDGLTLEQPLQGNVRIQADREPRVVAAVVTEKVLPTARPTISYGATDDFGLSALRMHVTILRARGEAEQREETILAETGGAHERLVRGAYPVDLKPYVLLKGDEIRVTLEAVDFRGTDERGLSLPGKAALSDPVSLQVTDESGILASLVEADEKSAKQLDTIPS